MTSEQKAANDLARLAKDLGCGTIASCKRCIWVSYTVGMIVGLLAGFFAGYGWRL